MGRNLLIAFTLLLSLELTDAVFRQFDCRRQGNSCLNGGICNMTNGECNCANGFEGYDCGLQSNQIKTAGGCGPGICQNGGICYTDVNFIDHCYCTEDFWGSICNRRRQVVESCGLPPDVITISINPTGNFGGRIYIRGEQDNNNCQFAAAGNGEYRLTFSDGDCPAGRTPGTSAGSFSYDVIVQYRLGLRTGGDARHTFSCSDGFTTTLTLGNIDDSYLNLDGLDVAVSSQAVNSRFTTAPERGVVPPMVYVGQELFLEFTVTHNPAATGVVVSQCDASAADVPGSTLQLVSGGCPMNEGSVVVSLTKDALGTTAFLRFKVFQFVPSNQVTITCNVAACGQPPLLGPATCSTPPTCPPAGRRKREADIDADVTVAVSRDLFIAATKQEVEMLIEKSKKSGKTEQESCLYSAAFISVTAVCGVLLVVSLTALVLIFFRLRTSRRVEDLGHPTKG